MAKIAVLCGPNRTLKYVEGIAFLPGLSVHKSTSGDGSMTITHIATGTYVLEGVKEDHLEVVRMCLGRMVWDKPATHIFRDKKYQRLIMEAGAVSGSASDKQENRIAADIGGKRQPASGSRPGRPRDVVTSRIMVEAKTTGKKNYLIKLQDLTFLMQQAYKVGRVPAYVVGVSDCADVAVILADDVLDETYEAWGIGRDDPLSGSKVGVTSIAVPITVDIAKRCNKGEILDFNASGRRWLLLGYERFLEFAKWGSDET